MEYITTELQKNKTYIQYDENGDLRVIYHFSPSNRMEQITIIKMPEYFLLPRIDIGYKRRLGVDYTIDCFCFDDLKWANIVCSGSDIRFLNNKSCELNLILSEEQCLFGVVSEQIGGMLPFDEPQGCLIVKHENMQKEDYKEIVSDGFPATIKTIVERLPNGTDYAPQFEMNKVVRVDKTKVYDSHFQKIKDLENIDEDKNERC